MPEILKQVGNGVAAVYFIQAIKTLDWCRGKGSVLESKV